MKKLIPLLIIMLTFSSCVAHTPLTNSKLELGYEEQKGAFISVKPFDSDIISKHVSDFLDWFTDDG